MVLYLSEGSLWYLRNTTFAFESKWYCHIWVILRCFHYCQWRLFFSLVPKVFFPPEVSFDMNTLLGICCMPIVCFPKLMSLCWCRHWKKSTKSENNIAIKRKIILSIMLPPICFNDNAFLWNPLKPSYVDCFSYNFLMSLYVPKDEFRSWDFYDYAVTLTCFPYCVCLTQGIKLLGMMPVIWGVDSKQRIRPVKVKWFFIVLRLKLIFWSPLIKFWRLLTAIGHLSGF